MYVINVGVNSRVEEKIMFREIWMCALVYFYYGYFVITYECIEIIFGFGMLKDLD